MKTNQLSSYNKHLECAFDIFHVLTLIQYKSLQKKEILFSADSFIGSKFRRLGWTLLGSRKV